MLFHMELYLRFIIVKNKYYDDTKSNRHRRYH
jgi:hypothetical protein